MSEHEENEKWLLEPRLRLKMKLVCISLTMQILGALMRDFGWGEIGKEILSPSSRKLDWYFLFSNFVFILADYGSKCDAGSYQTIKNIKKNRPYGWNGMKCCTAQNPCKKDEGGCTDDTGCLGGLKCGIDNCPHALGLIGISRCCELRKCNVIISDHN